MNGTFATGEAMAGYQIVTPKLGAALLGGVRRERHRLDLPDPGNPVQGARTGFAAAFDAWAKPADGILVTLAGNATTVFGGYYLRASAGHALPLGEDLFAGIEGVVLGNRQFRQYRIGGQISGYRVGAAQMGVSAGWLGDDGRSGRRGDGFYAAASLWHRR